MIQTLVVPKKDFTAAYVLQHVSFYIISRRAAWLTTVPEDESFSGQTLPFPSRVEEIAAKFNSRCWLGPVKAQGRAD